MRLVVPRADRGAGGARHGISAHQPLRVAGVKPPRRSRVEFRQPLAKQRAAEFSVERRGLITDPLGNFRKWRQSVLQCAQIEPGTANDDRQPPGCGSSSNLGEGTVPPRSDRAALRRVEEAVETVRRAGLRGGVGARRQDFEIAVALQRVGIDDDAAQLLRQTQCQGRFAAGGRTGNYDDA